MNYFLPEIADLFTMHSFLHCCSAVGLVQFYLMPTFVSSWLKRSIS